MAYEYCDLISDGEVVADDVKQDVQHRLVQHFKINKKSSVLLTERRGIKIKKKISPEIALRLQGRMLKLGLKTSISVNLDREMFVDGLRDNHPFTTDANYEVSFESRELVPTLATAPTDVGLANDRGIPWFRVSMPGIHLGYKFLLIVSFYLAVAMVIVISGLAEPMRGIPLHILQAGGFVLSVLFLPLLFDPQRRLLLSSSTQEQILIKDSMLWHPFRRTYTVFDEADKIVATINSNRFDPLNTETCAVNGGLMYFNENSVDADQVSEELGSEITDGIWATNMVTTIVMMLPDVFKKLKKDDQLNEYCRVRSGETEIAELFKGKRSHLRMTDAVPDKTTHLIALAHCLVSFGA